jgi:hypothetical protein
VFRLAEPSHLFSFRSHFYAPEKYFLGKYWDTFWFNILVVWVMTALCYVTLYYDLLRIVVEINYGKIIGRFMPKIKIPQQVKKFTKKIKIPRIVIRVRKRKRE